ncbi:MAG: hypothetical protein M5R40_08225 [Anaerolineae bacterium]|nr:hypothetical protein [Anaerolineae bacterium]
MDNDAEDETGVQIFAIAYWTNTWGDPFLEERDLQGGGWSSAYASTRVSEDASTQYEIIGGKFLVYAPDDQQGLPIGLRIGRPAVHRKMTPSCACHRVTRSSTWTPTRSPSTARRTRWLI